MDYGIDNIYKYTPKQIKTIYICVDKKELVDKLQHLDIKKIVPIDRRSLHYNMAAVGGCIIELSYCGDDEN